MRDWRDVSVVIMGLLFKYEDPKSKDSQYPRKASLYTQHWVAETSRS